MSYDRQSSISHSDPFYEDWGRWIDKASKAELHRELRNAKRRVAHGGSERLNARSRAAQHERNVWMVGRIERRLGQQS